MSKRMLTSKQRRCLRACGLALVAVIAARPALAQVRALRAADDKNAPPASAAARLADDADPYFKTLYRDFYQTYRIGPADKIAVRVVGQPEYSLEKVEVSPVGRIYHPLIGDIDVAGLSIDRLRDKLTLSFGEFIREPRVSVELVEANSAKIGILGDVTHPGIVVMARPMTVFDAVSSAGGVTDFGSRSNVTLLRLAADGSMRTFKINVKRVMEGKAGAEENPMLQAGDTVIVHGNFRKTLSTITQLAGFGSFVRIIAGR